MKKRTRTKPTLDERVCYEVVVAGCLGMACLDSYDTVKTVQVSEVPYDRTVITGIFDQAALQGILRCVYSRGFPLIAVKRVQGPSGKSATIDGTDDAGR